MALSARDLAIIWAALDSAEPPPTQQHVPPRIGRLADVFEASADQEALVAVNWFLRRAVSAGASISNSALPSAFVDVHQNHRIIMAAEAASVHEKRITVAPQDYPPRIAQLIEEGNAITATRYIASRNHQRGLAKSVLASFHDVDVLVTPAAPGVAPDPSTTGDPVFNSPWSYLGLPVLTIPIALSSEGLPLAIQLIGKPDGETPLLQAAIWCEDLPDDAG
jgi:aspartyl-tRNA(Asn)/glutamyl-tRNA(Gln) amidotransferase subunit A